MKTYKEFQEAAALAAPLVGLGVRAAAPLVTGAIGAAANILKAKGETTPRTPNVQRPSPKITAADAQKRQAAADRRAAAQERTTERAKQGIDSLIGSDAERKAAAQARANQPQIQQQLRRQNQRARMSKAADKLGLD